MLRPLLLALALPAVISGCMESAAPAIEESAKLPGGATSVPRHDKQAFAQPARNLSHEQQLEFSVGNSFFRNPWVIAPASTDARDGLGPLFHTNACINCHINDGRGQVPNDENSHSVGMLLRLSIPSSTTLPEHLANLAEPTYGTQLQDMAIPGIAPEGKVRLSYEAVAVEFADGSRVELRKPRVQISELGYGPLHPATQTSLRIAPSMIGLGLLEAIPAESILATADPDDRNADGISGKANWVWDLRQQRLQLGRFGWKAGQPSLAQQNAHAFANDLGLSNPLLAADDCTPTQTRCGQMPNGGEQEVSDNIFAKVEFYTRTLAVPTSRQHPAPSIAKGRELFFQAGCHSCHTPSHVTAANAALPELAAQVIWPYSDLLLHDMGDGLADQHSEYQASGREWRTAPLWGIGLAQVVNPKTSFLHDGRARTLLEAILWHGGEADSARQHVLQFNAEQREDLLAFLNSL